MEYRVRAEEDGWQVLRILRGSMQVSCSALKSAKWNGRILLNGRAVTVRTPVREGDLISMEWGEDTPAYSPKPFPMNLTIPFMDEHFMVVDKPAGIASQSSRNHPDDSLENAVYAFLGCPPGFVYRPVNRLDKGTGGLLVIARTPHAQHLLQEMLHTPRFCRRYLAWTTGIPETEEGVLDFPIVREPSATIRRIVSPDGRPCRTLYRVLKEKEDGALILLELRTGRTHQIRVHLSHIGCPVRGDFLYGTELPDAFPGCFALHSAFLSLVHPLTGEHIHFISRPPWAREIEDARLLADFE